MPTIGVAWVEDYHGLNGLADLLYPRIQTTAFWVAMSGTVAFVHGNDAAMDIDLEEPGTGIPGRDTQFADAVDLTYFAGHGGADGVFFGVKGPGNGAATRREMRLGNGAIKWLVFDSCNTLYDADDGPLTKAATRWGPVFAGLHYLLGFATLSYDEPYRGRIFAQYLNQPKLVRHAWRFACQETEEADVEWAYLRADGGDGHGGRTDTASDRWIGRGFVSPSPTVPDYFEYLSGSC